MGDASGFSRSVVRVSSTHPDQLSVNDIVYWWGTEGFSTPREYWWLHGMGTFYISERWMVSPQVQAATVEWCQLTSVCVRVISSFSEPVNESRTSSLKLCWTHDQKLVDFASIIPAMRCKDWQKCSFAESSRSNVHGTIQANSLELVFLFALSLSLRLLAIALRSQWHFFFPRNTDQPFAMPWSIQFLFFQRQKPFLIHGFQSREITIPSTSDEISDFESEGVAAEWYQEVSQTC
jgi:hypothetical protein